MANHVELPFQIYVHTDGTTSTIVTNTSTSPYLWGNSTSYNLVASLAGLTPMGVNGVTSSDGTVCSGSVGLLGAITYTWVSPPIAGDFIITGNVEF
jgi:hypothetical protein